MKPPARYFVRWTDSKGQLIEEILVKGTITEVMNHIRAKRKEDPEKYKTHRVVVRDI